MPDPREKRVPFMMSDRELLEVDEWRFTNRVATRADALRRLCKLGLALDRILPRLEDAITEATVVAKKAARELTGTSKSSKQHQNVPAELALTSMKLITSVRAMTKLARVFREYENPEEKLKELDESADELAAAFKVMEGFLRKNTPSV
ncbi:acyl carrier protein phosphodiesterase [Neorhizobium sp. 2083]|uniref:hypothetical protein n=1 Tax=Neorhizobium sp. 2083 TaxID=2817762 RepID=UPI000DE13DCA|nr:hypothetical protein [Neorhizobium sp. 2083]MDR6817020.1 acyl carrier protein phosphodiesterase [Neorhizobium sp. 2083]